MAANPDHTQTPDTPLMPDTDSTGPQCLSVMYHYVHDAAPNGCGDVRGLSIAGFQRQLDQLCKSADPVDWPTVYAWRQGRGSIPDRSFLLTFDDGLADHAHVVGPILKKRGIKGVFFVPGDVLVLQRLLPAHAIHLLLASLGEERFEGLLTDWLTEHNHGDQWLTSCDTAAAARMYHYETPARAKLKFLLTATLPIELRNSALEALFVEHVGSPTRWSRHWYLTWDDLVALEAQGHTIGGHGQCHEPYARLTDAQVRQDVRSIAAVLAGGLGPDLRPYSYPYGSYTDVARDACRKAGFAHAFTTERRWLDSDADPMLQPRVDTIHVDAQLVMEPTCPRG